MKLKDNYLLLLVMVCIAIFFVNLDAILVNIMEARNFATAREMINLDHWIFTTLNNEPRYEKPPLPTWLTALSMLLFGMKSLFALRLPAAIMGTITVIFIYKLGFKITAHRKFAFIAGLIGVTSFYILHSGRDGQWDIHTHAWMIMAIYGMYRIFAEEGNKYTNGVIAGLLLGCSFLSKGPVSMYGLLLPFLIAYGAVYKYKNLRSKWKPLILMVLIAFIVSASWSLYVYFFDTHAVAKITEKETGRWLDYNTRPIYYYWSFVIQTGIWTIPAFVSLLYPYLKNRVFDKPGYKFTLWWTLASVVLLSIIPEKKSRYLLPVLIPLALNTAFYIEYLFRRFDMMPKKEKLVVYFNFSLIALIGLAFPIIGFYFLKDIFSEIWPWFLITSICLGLIGILIFYYLRRNRIKPVFYLSVWFIICIIFFAFPIAKKMELNPSYKSISVIDQHFDEDDLPVYEFSGFTPELIWEYGRPIKDLKNENAYDIPDKERFLLLVTESQTKEMKTVLSGFKIEKIDEIDMNASLNSHRERLYRNLFLISSE
ncbi:ArnT family glycosyltransferase [Christiangramia forsetii]|uniref:ArnT-like undecaprenyl-phosphate alpha-4-amino-4-deoxy-L-arabinose arabinosyl transferase n=2 Tax=Christiangramia forsetii TaxID=411153 RepID=A0M219_CHRFK|nr:glycosyltransferase family 39 protein [Christiangramia forsetii]GGG44769.1 glycosyl transferase [Christiangramia forsetii]CAL66664.1 ArnT-like undecaprenyl-phosphate alpha-4-amino-4-deoxy-L-arabinose arabinosyl transferase [Christiangramia forsetii KT0803]